MTTTEAPARLSIRTGHTMLLDEQLLQRNSCLSIEAGLVRVGISQPEQEALNTQPITLGFLQTGDHLPLDLLRTARLHLQALTPTRLVEGCSALPPAGASSLNDWTVALLLIRHLGEAERRITALLQLLVQRLGHRRGDWYELPIRLTHAELAELSGHTRVTVTRQLSRWRDQGLIEQDEGPSRCLRIAPELIEG
ncbi:MAG: Crp/Fnr family transcriptional regulator [Cyanobacteriota bacterium]|jgi:CRP-like cAMP-binding protein|nr:Crp/Fnr family transcriptional regulator [Cyanobacteriota bacterium]